MKPSEIAARHDLTADSSRIALDLGLAPDRHLRSQRRRCYADLAAKDEINQGKGVEALRWEPLTAIPKTHNEDVPDLDWLLDLNNLAQTETQPSHALAWPTAPSQVLLPELYENNCHHYRARRGLVAAAL